VTALHAQNERLRLENERLRMLLEDEGAQKTADHLKLFRHDVRVGLSQVRRVPGDRYAIRGRWRPSASAESRHRSPSSLSATVQACAAALP
jgi:hypothetical protein